MTFLLIHKKFHFTLLVTLAFGIQETKQFLVFEFGVFIVLLVSNKLIVYLMSLCSPLHMC